MLGYYGRGGSTSPSILSANEPTYAAEASIFISR